MRRLRLRWVGGTGRLDPRTAPMPTFLHATYDEATGTVLVDVPDADVPDHPAWDAARVVPGQLNRVGQPRLTHEHYQLWYAHLDERYAEHAGRFRPTVVQEG